MTLFYASASLVWSNLVPRPAPRRGNALPLHALRFVPSRSTSPKPPYLGPSRHRRCFPPFATFACLPRPTLLVLHPPFPPPQGILLRLSAESDSDCPIIASISAREPSSAPSLPGIEDSELPTEDDDAPLSSVTHDEPLPDSYGSDHRHERARRASSNATLLCWRGYCCHCRWLWAWTRYHREVHQSGSSTT